MENGEFSMLNIQYSMLNAHRNSDLQIADDALNDRGADTPMYALQSDELGFDYSLWLLAFAIPSPSPSPFYNRHGHFPDKNKILG